MAEYTVQTSSMSGAVLTMGAVSGTGVGYEDSFANDGKTFLIVANGAGAPIDVTIDSQLDCDQGFDHDLTITVANGTEKMIGPFSTARFSPVVLVTYSSPTSITAAAVRHTA